LGSFRIGFRASLMFPSGLVFVFFSELVLELGFVQDLFRVGVSFI
jgi:hypothetical protein